MRNYILLALFGMLLSVTKAQASGWAFMSKHAEFKGFAIIDVGEIEKVFPPLDTTWAVELYRLNGRCFTLSGFYGALIYGKKAAFLLGNEKNQIKIGLFEASVSAVNADIHSATLYECPSGVNTNQHNGDLNEVLRMYERRRLELEQELENLRQGQ